MTSSSPPRPEARPAETRRPRAGARLGVRACGHGDDPGHDGAVRELVAEIAALHGELAALPCLAPGPRTDALFTRLVALASARRDAGIADRVLADDTVAGLLVDLRARCARGEYELERAWAHHVLAAADPAAALAAFPYLANYTDLTRIEYHAVTGHAPHAPQRALFVGSGPLPLSAMMLARHGVAVDALDLDPEAVALGAGVAAAVGDRVDVRQGDITDPADSGDLGHYDLVCLAALVGLDPATKEAALAHVRARMRPGATVLARSAHSLRALLYPVLDVDALGGLDPLAVLHPYGDVVNSVVLARVP